MLQASMFERLNTSIQSTIGRLRSITRQQASDLENMSQTHKFYDTDKIRKLRSPQIVQNKDEQQLRIRRMWEDVDTYLLPAVFVLPPAITLLVANPKITAPLAETFLIQEEERQAQTMQEKRTTLTMGDAGLRQSMTKIILKHHQDRQEPPKRMRLSRFIYHHILPIIRTDECESHFVIADNPAIPPIPYEVDETLDDNTIVCIS